MRADTNLGNILLNILLSEQIPTTRSGFSTPLTFVADPDPVGSVYYWLSRILLLKTYKDPAA